MDGQKFTIIAPLTIVERLNKTVASDNISAINPQQDCLYMKSVLVSTGQNKNDDVFLPSEMWRARSTPETKPVNWEHNTGYEIVDSPEGDGKRVVADNQIIGVMQNSYPANKDGTPISSEAALAEGFEIPQDFDIITEAVIWKYLFPKTAAKLISEASANRIFVSMEAWFNKFDYRVGNKIVARNEETAFLDSHLRSNGGDGSFEGQNVGRVLRNIVFGGVGIVANPANEDSVIHSFTNAELKDVEITNSAIASNTIGQINSNVVFEESQEVCNKMADKQELNTSAQVNITSDDYKLVVERLIRAEHAVETKEAELAATAAEVESLKANVDNVKSAFAKGADSLAAVLGEGASIKISKADADKFFDVLVDVISDKLSSQDEVKAELDEAKAELAKLSEEKKLSSRATEIQDGLSLTAEDKERVDKLVSSTEKLDDEAFAVWLENTVELFSSAKQDDEKEDKKKKEEKEKKGNPFAKSASDDDGITDTSILDNVVADDNVPAGVENAVASVSLPERMQALATALLGANKRDNKEGGN